MNTIHDEMNKRFDERFGRLVMAQQSDFFGEEPYGSDDIKDFIKSEIEQERNKTIDECIACVGKERPMDIFSFVLQGEELEDYMKNKGHNICREQTITNLNNLKNLKNNG